MTIADKLLRAKTDYDEVYYTAYGQGKGAGIEQGYEEGYDIGYSEGKAEGGGGGYDQGFEAGKQAEYDAFWNKYQKNGNRTLYKSAFSGAGWSQDTLTPKYTIKPSTKSYSTGAYGLFEYCGWIDNPIDFSVIPMDFTDCTRGERLFANANALKIVVDLSTFTSLKECFMCNDGGAIKDITLKVSDKCTDYTSAFGYCSQLTNLTFATGSTIAASINLQWSTNLDKESLISVINALSTTTSGLTVTLSQTAVETAFGSTTSSEWTTLIGTRSNWTIALA